MQRENNEDSYLVLNEKVSNLSNLYIVADGMGGHQSGEIASKKSISYFIKFINSKSCINDDILDFMVEAVKYSNKKVYEDSLENEKLTGMGTTFTACTIMNNKCYVTHVGDSRLYIINNNKIKIITTDHSYVNEMLRAGEITEEEAKVHPQKNALTRALGVDLNLEVDGYIFDINLNDIILICSDGLTNTVKDEELCTIISNKQISLEKKVDILIDTANQNGGFDNITAILIELECD